MDWPLRGRGPTIVAHQKCQPTVASMQMTRARTQEVVKGVFCSGKQGTTRNSRVLPLSLKNALPLLERGLLPQHSFEDFAEFLYKVGKEKNGDLVLRLYAYFVKRGLEVDRVLGNHLVPMLVGAGFMHYAQQVFDKLAYRNEWSCYCLVTGYINNGKPHQAFTLYEKMHGGGFACLSGHILVALLNACAKLKDLDRGMEIHVEVAKMGLLERNPYVGSALVDLYGKCGMPGIAQQLFNKISDRDVVSWNALITGYAEQGLGREALRCFEQMQINSVAPSAITFICILKACGSLKAIEKGQEIHAEIVRQGLQENNLIVGNALLDMYSKCGSFEIARYIFDQLSFRDIVSWNSLLTGYAEYGCGEEGLKCFEQMQLKGIAPDPVTLVSSLKVCNSIGDLRKGGDIHAEIERQGLLEVDLYVGSTLVDMYAKGGSIAKAQQVFDRLPVRGVVLWTALMAGYAESGHCEEALKCLDRMQFEGFLPNAVTFVWCLKACGATGAMEKGGEIHAEVERRGMLEQDLIGNTLVDMYAKCGLLAKACQAFYKLPCRDIVSWTALISGFVQVGESENAFHFFDQMLREGVKPNHVTVAVVLSGCSCIGLYSRCQTYLEIMSKDYGIVPTLEHHNCVVNLFGRVGQVENALALMQLYPNRVAWQSVLGACKQLGSVEFGKRAFEHAVCSDGKDALAYVLMGHIYASGPCKANQQGQ